MGDQRSETIKFERVSKPTQLKKVIVLLSISAFVNHTDNVENTKSIGKPAEKPGKHS